MIVTIALMLLGDGSGITSSSSGGGSIFVAADPQLVSCSSSILCNPLHGRCSNDVCLCRASYWGESCDEYVPTTNGLYIAYRVVFTPLCCISLLYSLWHTYKILSSSTALLSCRRCRHHRANQVAPAPAAAAYQQQPLQQQPSSPSSSSPSLSHTPFIKLFDVKVAVLVAVTASNVIELIYLTDPFHLEPPGTTIMSPKIGPLTTRAPFVLALFASTLTIRLFIALHIKVAARATTATTAAAASTAINTPAARGDSLPGGASSGSGSGGVDGGNNGGDGALTRATSNASSFPSSSSSSLSSRRRRATGVLSSSLCNCCSCLRRLCCVRYPLLVMDLPLIILVSLFFIDAAAGGIISRRLYRIVWNLITAAWQLLIFIGLSIYVRRVLAMLVIHQSLQLQPQRQEEEQQQEAAALDPLKLEQLSVSALRHTELTQTLSFITRFRWISFISGGVWIPLVVLMVVGWNNSVAESFYFAVLRQTHDAAFTLCANLFLTRVTGIVVPPSLLAPPAEIHFIYIIILVLLLIIFFFL